jgi:hypothetical protein
VSPLSQQDKTVKTSHLLQVNAKTFEKKTETSQKRQTSKMEKRGPESLGDGKLEIGDVGRLSKQCTIFIDHRTLDSSICVLCLTSPAVTTYKRLKIDEKEVSVAQVASKSDPESATEVSVVDGDRRFVSFPERLIEILECKEFNRTIRWNTEGNAFGIIPETFSEKVLKKQFQGTKFESFTRKLNRWGFKRVVDEGFPTNAMLYRHELFRRGKPELLKNMKGSKTKEPDLREQQLLLEALSQDLLTTPDVPLYLRKGRLNRLTSLGSQLMQQPPSESPNPGFLLPEVACQQLFPQDGWAQGRLQMNTPIMNMPLNVNTISSLFATGPALDFQQADRIRAMEKYSMAHHLVQEQELQTRASLLTADHRLRSLQAERELLTRLTRSSQMSSSVPELGLSSQVIRSSPHFSPAVASIPPGTILSSSLSPGRLAAQGSFRLPGDYF